MDNIVHQSSAQQMITDFNQRMEYFEGELRKNLEQSPNISSLSAEFARFKAFTVTALKALQDQIELNTRSIDNLEMQSRRKILLIHGVPEVQSEDTSSVVVKTVVGKLKLTQFSAADISRCHRMGRTSANKPRPILIKFQAAAVKDGVWQAKSKLKNSGITLSEFLTKTRHEVFMAARERFGVSKCWTRDGSVYIAVSDGSRQRVNWMSDLIKITGSAHPQPSAPVSELPVTSPKPPAVVKEMAVQKTRRAVASKK